MINATLNRSLAWFKLLAVACTFLALTACATGKSVNNVDAMVDDGERNTMLLSYEVTMNVTDKYASVGSTNLIVHCGQENRLGKVPECFRVKVPLQGRRNLDGYEYYTFSDAGTKIVQMPYGAFDVKSVAHNVVVDKHEYSRCGNYGHGYGGGYGYGFGHGYGHSYGSSRLYSNSRRYRSRRLYNCLPYYVDITAKHRSPTPITSSFQIGPGKGCYAGHLSLVMTDGELTRYTLDQNNAQLSDEALNQLPLEFREAVQERGFEPCVSS